MAFSRLSLVCNCLSPPCFCAKMPFLRLPLVKFSHVAVLHIENFTFGIHKNDYFIPKNRSTQTVTNFLM